MIEALKGKHKNLGFIEQLEQGKDLKNNKAFFTCQWNLKGYPKISGTATDYNKQKARNMAAQNFLKSLFHNELSLFKGKTFSWLQLVD